MAVFDASRGRQRVTLQTRKVTKGVFRGFIALRVPAAFFEIILRRVALYAHPWAQRSKRLPWRFDPTPDDFKKQIRRLVVAALCFYR